MRDKRFNNLDMLKENRFNLWMIRVNSELASHNDRQVQAYYRYGEAIEKGKQSKGTIQSGEIVWIN